MITNLATLRAALKPKAGRKPLFAGIVLYEGKSQLDGAPIVAIASKIEGASKNAKTGAMVQTFIMRSDIRPMTALAGGEDASVCGSCIHRPLLAKGTGTAPCYVQVAKSVTSVWEAWALRDRYARPGVDFAANLLPLIFEGLAFRLGTYGDPAAVPFQVWRAATMLVAFKNGYTHQWQDSRFQAFRLLCMASADSESEMHAAHAAGWRTFRVRSATEALVKDREIMCPASKEAGVRTDCASCKACGGLSARAKISIVIMAHGMGVKHAIAA